MATNDFIHLHIHESDLTIFVPFHRLHEVTNNVCGGEVPGIVLVDPFEPRGKSAFVCMQQVPDEKELDVYGIRDAIARGLRLEVSQIDFD